MRSACKACLTANLMWGSMCECVHVCVVCACECVHACECVWCVHVCVHVCGVCGMRARVWSVYACECVHACLYMNVC